MLILAGTTIVNEANLTGEPTPQWKVLRFFIFLTAFSFMLYVSKNLCIHVYESTLMLMLIIFETTWYFQVSITGRGSEEPFSFKRDKKQVIFGGTKIMQRTPDMVVHDVTSNSNISFSLQSTIYVFFCVSVASDFSYENAIWWLFSNCFTNYVWDNRRETDAN